MASDRNRVAGERVSTPMVRTRLVVAFAGHYLAWLAGRYRTPAAPRHKTDSQHRVDVTRLQRALGGSRPPVRLVKRGAGHEARTRPAGTGTELDLRPLDAVLDVDREARTAIVEPQVTMRQLVGAAGRVGLAPAVIPEFAEITVGGAVQGLAAESSSHRFGLFHESIEWLDVVLGDGTLLRISPSEHQDLWQALPGSYGSLAIVVLACLRLAPRSSHVSVLHRRMSLGDLIATEVPAQHDFVDAVCDRDEEVVVTTADLCSGGDRGVRRPRWYREYYCDHVMTTASVRGPETMRFEDYVFRYDRGAFWIAPTKLGRSLPSRLLFGGFATASNLYRLRRARQAISSAPSSRLVQDCIVPAANAPALIELLREVTAGPLWLLPIHCAADNLFGLAPGAWINVGAYVRLDVPGPLVTAFNRRLEHSVAQLGGFKTLHAEVFYDRERFAAIYDMAAYDTLRSRYRADGVLAHIHDKLGIADGR